MENHFVTYKQALALKEIGFDGPCLYSYYQDGTIASELKSINWNLSDTLCSAPIKSQVFEWARKEHVLYHIVHQFEHKKNTTEEFLSEVSGKLLMGNDDISGFSYHSTYEEAESACIDKLIEIVKSKKQ